jgi:hypothetical protein
VQSHQGINPRTVEEADVFAIHHDAGMACIQVFFFRTGQNWGNRAYFPKADPSLAPGEILGAFIGQFYDNKPNAAADPVSIDFEDRPLLAEALSMRMERKVAIADRSAARSASWSIRCWPTPRGAWPAPGRDREPGTVAGRPGGNLRPAEPPGASRFTTTPTSWAPMRWAA